MRLSIKIASAMTLLIILAVLVVDFVAIRREAQLLESDIARDARLVAMGMAQVVEQTDSWSHPQLTALGSETPSPDVEVSWLSASDLNGLLTAEDAATLQAGQPLVQRSDNAYTALAPVSSGDQLRGAVQVRETLAARDAFVRRAWVANLLTLVAIAVLCGLSALGLGRRLVGDRVNRLVSRARAIGAGETLPPLPVVGSDELSLLETEQNAMALELASRSQRAQDEAEARIRAQEQLRHADRLTTVGHMAAGMAHEFGTPLNVIAGRAQMIVGRGSTDQDVKDAGIVVDQSARITRIVQRMLRFSRRDQSMPSDGDMRIVVTDSIALLEATARKAGVTLVPHVPDTPLLAHVDHGQLQQVLTNLMMNAIQAMPDGGEITVTLSTAAPNALRLQIADQGVGMPAEVADRVFDPFFTTKEPGEGTGLGLSVVYGIVSEHQGTVSVTSQPGQGAVFTVELPLKGPS